MKTIILIIFLALTNLNYSQILSLMDDNAVSTPVDTTGNYLTSLYIARVVADGGTVTDSAEVNASYALGLDMDNVFCWVSPAFGVKKDANNKVTKLYDLSNNDNDLVQADTSKSPTWYADSLLFDGVNDDMKDSWTSQSQPNLVTIATRNNSTGNKYFYDGITARNALGQGVAPLNMFAGTVRSTGYSIALNERSLITVDFNTTDTTWVNGSYTGSGDAGAQGSDGITLMNNIYDDGYKKGTVYEFFFSTTIGMREIIETIMNRRWGIY